MRLFTELLMRYITRIEVNFCLPWLVIYVGLVSLFREVPGYNLQMGHDPSFKPLTYSQFTILTFHSTLRSI